MRERRTCIDCGISLSIVEPGGLSPVTCADCTGRIHASGAGNCYKCGRIIAVGECFVPAAICSVCADDHLRKMEIEAWDEYVFSDGENERGEISNLYGKLRDELKSRNWNECISIARLIPVTLEIAH